MDGNGLSKRSVPEHLSSGLQASAGSEKDLRGKRGVTVSKGRSRRKTQGGPHLGAHGQGFTNYKSDLKRTES